MKNRIFKTLRRILGIIIGIFIIDLTINNLVNTDITDLSRIDRAVIDEYENFQESDDELWQDYKLRDKDIIVINKKFLGNTYLFSNDSSIKSIFAKKINNQNDKVNIYRITKFHPKKLQFAIGNFNEKDKNYKILGKENIFYIKYDEDSVDKKFSSYHFLPFLSHEALHYYMQKDWDNLTFRGYAYNEKELELLDKEYKVLSKIKNAIENKAENDELLTLGNEYLKVMDERFEKTDKEKIDSEIFEETMEGAANYVSIKASKIIGYDYGILYFDNTKDVDFADIVPTLKKGEVDQSILGEKIVYESGALLCKYLDAIGDKNWQEKLNSKGKTDISLYSIIKENLK